MSALNEIKDRIASVRSTLKITSAMKLVASSKLHKAEAAIAAIRPYERTLEDIVAVVEAYKDEEMSMERDNSASPVAVVAISSNSALCGAFNANVIAKTLELCHDASRVRLFPIGKKVSAALARAGFSTEGDFSDLIAKPDYAKSEAFARELSERYDKGEFSKIVLVYNHFVSSSSQEPVFEQYLPYDRQHDKAAGEVESIKSDDYIFEPDPAELADKVIPYLLLLKFHAAILDSAAAEHAARTVAMQTASENAERLLSDLTLEYNKGRQEKITSELLDLEAAEA